jgi:hypothetical protein
MRNLRALSNIEPCWTNVALSTASNLFFSIRSDSAIVNNTRKSRKIHTKSVKDEKSLNARQMYANASEDEPVEYHPRERGRSTQIEGDIKQNPF